MVTGHSMPERETQGSYPTFGTLEHTNVNRTCDAFAGICYNNITVRWQPFLFTHHSPYRVRMTCWHSSSFHSRFYSAAPCLVPISTTMKSLLFLKRPWCLFPTWRTASSPRLDRCFTQLPRGGRGVESDSVRQGFKAQLARKNPKNVKFKRNFLILWIKGSG